MESIILTMRPDRCEQVTDKVVTLDVRKSKISVETPFKVYLYCTKPKRGPVDSIDYGRVVGEFICKKIHFFPYAEMFAPPDWEESLGMQYYITCGQLERSGMSYSELCAYGKKKNLYGLEISDLELYKIPKPLSEFCYVGAPAPDDLDDKLCDYCRRTEWGEHRECHTPNGIIMCEGRWCEEAYEEFLEQEYMIVHPPRSFCRVEVIR